MQSNTKCISGEEYLKLLSSKIDTNRPYLLSMYTSEFDVVVDDETSMVIPVNDKMIGRGWGVWSVMTVKNYKFYQVDRHVDRFIHCAKVAELNVPLTKEEMIDRMKRCCLRAYEKHKLSKDQRLSLRLFISGGTRDFSIFDQQSVFYAILYKEPVFEELPQYFGTRDYTIPEVPYKPKRLAIIKSTNYLLNCVLSKYAKERGGFWGFFVDDHDNLIEASKANIVIVNNDNEFLTIPFDNILAGTTLARVIDYTESTLIKEGIIKSIHYRNFTRKEVFETAKELFIMGGDLIIPITELDDHVIADGKRGPICERLQNFIQEDLETGESFENYLNQQS